MSLLSRLWASLRGLFRRSAPKSAFDPSLSVSHVFVDVDAHVDPALLAAMCPGLQAQLREDLAPEWGVGALDTVRVLTPSDPVVRPGEVEIQMHAEAPADQAGALAIHDKKPDGTPILHVYVALAQRSGASTSSCTSHEILEARVDPELDQVATLPDGRVAAIEVCDAVEESLYQKLGVEVSDFSTRANFGIAGSSRKFDFLGLVKTIFAVLAGGYAQVRDPDRGWIQLGPSEGTAAREAPLAARGASTGHEAYRAELDRLGISRGSRRAARRP